MPTHLEQNQSEIVPETPIQAGEDESILSPENIEWLNQIRSEEVDKREGGLLTPEDESLIAELGILLAKEQTLAERAKRIDDAITVDLAIGRAATAPFRANDPTLQHQSTERRRKAHNPKTRGKNKPGFSVSTLVKGRTSTEKSEKERGGWPVFKGKGILFTPTVAPYGNGDDRVSLLLSRGKKDRADEDIKITYRPDKTGKGVIFSGMLIPKELRGMGLSTELFKYFLDGVEQKGLRFVGTGVINKPLMALVLKKAGLVPEDKDYLAIVLPNAKDDPDIESSVTFMRDAGDGARKVTGTKSGKEFYRTVPLTSVPTSILTDRRRRVALHTRWFPRDLAVH
jgi:hypothetical protein